MKCVCELGFLLVQTPDVKIFIQTDFLVPTFLFSNAYFLLEKLLSTFWTRQSNKISSRYYALLTISCFSTRFLFYETKIADILFQCVTAVI